MADPTRVILDNDALAALHNCPSPTRARVIRALSGRENLVVHGTEELLDELIAMHESGSHEELPKRAEILLGVMRGAPFRYYKEIVSDELLGEPAVYSDIAPVRQALRAIVDKRVSVCL